MGLGEEKKYSSLEASHIGWYCFWEGPGLASLLRYVLNLSSHREADPWQKADSCCQTESEPGNHENYFYRKEGP